MKYAWRESCFVFWSFIICDLRHSTVCIEILDICFVEVRGQRQTGISRSITADNLIIKHSITWSNALDDLQKICISTTSLPIKCASVYKKSTVFSDIIAKKDSSSYLNNSADTFKTEEISLKSRKAKTLFRRFSNKVTSAIVAICCIFGFFEYFTFGEAIYIDGEKIADMAYTLSFGESVVLQAGKRKFAKLVH